MTNKYYETPEGIAIYPKLVKPDTKFNAEGVYSTRLVLSPEAAAPLIAQIEEVFVDTMGTKKLASMVKPYEENEDGNIVFKFKSKNKPGLFDGAGKPILRKELKLGNGSTLKLKGSMNAQTVQGKNYITLYVNAAQVIDLVEFGGAGFGAVDGAYVDDGDDEAANDDNGGNSTDATNF